MFKLRDIFLDPDERVMVRAAEFAFNSACDGEMASATLYGANPTARAAAWSEIRALVLNITNMEARPRTLAIRSELANQIEHVCRENFYSNLPPADRELWAREVYELPLSQADANCLPTMAFSVAYACVLQTLLYNGWDGTEDGKQAIKDCEKVFIDQCREQLRLLLASFQSGACGEALSDAEKDQMKLVTQMKELARRGLSGEPLDG